MQVADMTATDETYFCEFLHAELVPIVTIVSVRLLPEASL